MKEPQHPARPAFYKAADAEEAWRQQQLAALTETQQKIYDQARQKAEEREKAKETELAERRQADIQERMRNKLLETPKLVLEPGRKPVKMTETLARRLVQEHFGQRSTPENMIYAMAVSQAKGAAIREIDHEHARERQATAHAQREVLDSQLRGFEGAREAQPERREEFARAAPAGKAKTDFAKSTTTAVAKSPAIARAIEKVRKQEEQERARAEREREQGRGGPGHSR